MTAKESHGVVVVRTSISIIHRPETYGHHGEGTLRTDDWELFPNYITAQEAGYTLCGLCFYRELQQSG